MLSPAVPKVIHEAHSSTLLAGDTGVSVLPKDWDKETNLGKIMAENLHHSKRARTIWLTSFPDTYTV